jgi:hypothetical protein
MTAPDPTVDTTLPQDQIDARAGTFVYGAGDIEVGPTDKSLIPPPPPPPAPTPEAWDWAQKIDDMLAGGPGKVTITVQRD